MAAVNISANLQQMNGTVHQHGSRIYVFGHEAVKPAVYYSDDLGAHWTGPADAANAPAGGGVGNTAWKIRRNTATAYACVKDASNIFSVWLFNMDTATWTGTRVGAGPATVAAHAAAFATQLGVADDGEVLFPYRPAAGNVQFALWNGSVWSSVDPSIAATSFSIPLWDTGGDSFVSLKPAAGGTIDCYRFTFAGVVTHVGSIVSLGGGFAMANIGFAQTWETGDLRYTLVPVTWGSGTTKVDLMKIYLGDLTSASTGTIIDNSGGSCWNGSFTVRADGGISGLIIDDCNFPVHYLHSVATAFEHGLLNANASGNIALGGVFSLANGSIVYTYEDFGLGIFFETFPTQTVWDGVVLQRDRSRATMIVAPRSIGD